MLKFFLRLNKNKFVSQWEDRDERDKSAKNLFFNLGNDDDVHAANDIR